VTPLSAAAAADLLAGDEIALFDVREAGEAERGHIAGATRLPRRVIELRLEGLVPRRSTCVLVYDGGDGRAVLAGRRMEELGYSDVRMIEGGSASWQAAGFVLVSGSNVASKQFGERVSEHEGTPHVDPETLSAWRESGLEVMICDIRTPEEYRGQRIPGAFSTPGFDAMLCAQDLAQSGKTLVVNCAGRTRSIIACESLRKLGVQRVFALENGTMGWLLSNRALEDGAGAGRIEPSAEGRAWARARAGRLANSVGVGFVSVPELGECLDQRTRGLLNLYVFDVRQVPEFEAGHIAGSAALPGALAVQRTDEFVAVRGGKIVLVDDDETRALMTAYWFRRMGIPKVAVLRGGVAGFEPNLVKGRERAPPLALAEARDGLPRITRGELCWHRAAGREPIVIDVGTSATFNKRHLPRAVWVPRGWLEMRIRDVAPDPQAALLVTCPDAVQSSFAAATLVRLGYRDVAVLDGGTRTFDVGDLVIDEATAPSEDDIVRQPYEKGLSDMKQYLEWEVALSRQNRRLGL
jgi:rhodanese-related sulfurtransferase